MSLRSRFPEIEAEPRPRVSEAVHAAAEAIAASAKGRVPVATGRLRDAIHVEHEGSARYSVVAGDNQAWYGHLVELGTSHTAAHPFLVPALEEERPIAVELVVAALRHL